MDSQSTIPPLGSESTANIPPFSPGGMYRAHDLERHVDTYTLTDSDMDLMESAGPLFDICIAVASFFGSTTVTCYLSDKTILPERWTAQQYALFYYAPAICIVLTGVSAFLAFITWKRRSGARTRIKRESFVPGTYVSQRSAP